MSQKYFIDVHNLKSGTFPDSLRGEKAFVAGFAEFEAAAETEGVTALRSFVNVQEGKAYCYTTGPNAEAVRHAHDKIDLPIESITEVKTVTAGEIGRD